MTNASLYPELGKGRNALDSQLADAPERVFQATDTTISAVSHTDSVQELALFKSLEDYKNKQSVKVNTEISYGAFSADAHLSFSSFYSLHRERIAAVVTKYYVHERVNLDSVSGASRTSEFSAASAALPERFTPDNAHLFYYFYSRFGTHVPTSIAYGGKLHYQTLVDKQKMSDEQTITVSANAEYGEIFKVDGTYKQTAETRRFMESRLASMHTEGGDSALVPQLSFDQPVNQFNKLERWIASTKTHKAPIRLTFRPTFEFILNTARRKAAEDALPVYLARHLRVSADWEHASLFVGRGVADAPSAALADPAIKVRLLDRQTLGGDLRTFVAPQPSGDQARMTAFWGNLMHTLRAAGLKDKIVMLATERWPRDPRSCPSSEVIDFLRDECGASDAALRRWAADSRRTVPCPFSGISYGLIGSGAGAHGDESGDVYAIGFGLPGAGLKTNVEISARLTSTEAGAAVVKLNKAVNETGLTLRRIRNQAWDWVLTAGDGEPQRRPTDPMHHLKLAKQIVDPAPAEHLWYAHPLDKYGARYNYLINAATCECIEWNSNGAEKYEHAKLVEYLPNRDINLWQLRWPHIMCASWNPSWDLLARNDQEVVVASFTDGRPMMWTEELVEVVL